MSLPEPVHFPVDASEEEQDKFMDHHFPCSICGNIYPLEHEKIDNGDTICPRCVAETNEPRYWIARAIPGRNSTILTAYCPAIDWPRMAMCGKWLEVPRRTLQRLGLLSVDFQRPFIPGQYGYRTFEALLDKRDASHEQV